MMCVSIFDDLGRRLNGWTDISCCDLILREGSTLRNELLCHHWHQMEIKGMAEGMKVILLTDTRDITERNAMG